MTINEIQNQIIEEFEGLDDWMDRYALLIDYGNELESLPEQYRTDNNLIEGCQSKVWLQADKDGDKIRYQADSDAILVKGMVALLVRVLNEQPIQDILDADLYFIDKIGLKEHLSPTRSNGLLAMVKQMRLYALAFSVKK